MILLCVPFISVGFFIFCPFLVRATSMVETERIHRQASTPEVHRNKLNELSGKEWIKFTKSWFVHRPEPRGDRKIRHPASFPESLVKDFVSFFTRKGELVVDPFVGTGSTLVAALETGRSGIGFEIRSEERRVGKECRQRS